MHVPAGSDLTNSSRVRSEIRYVVLSCPHCVPIYQPVIFATSSTDDIIRPSLGNDVTPVHFLGYGIEHEYSLLSKHDTYQLNAASCQTTAASVPL